MGNDWLLLLAPVVNNKLDNNMNINYFIKSRLANAVNVMTWRKTLRHPIKGRRVEMSND